MPVRPRAPLIIAVVNPKGGVGKTMIATNVAAAGHREGRDTHMLDLDPQASACLWFAARSDESSLAGLNVTAVATALSRPKLLGLTAGHDLVVLDTPAQRGEVVEAAAVAADLVLIPFRPGPTDVWAARRTLELLNRADQIRAHLGDPPVRRRIILNDALARTRVVDYARDALDALEGKAEILHVILHSRVAFAEAMGIGESVLTFAPSSPAADEIQALWAALMTPVTGGAQEADDAA
jgi:chromosome partitioning protein